MARKRRHPTASRQAGLHRLLWWLALGGAGIGGGVFLGSMVVGTGLRDIFDRDTSYARLSANPNALASDTIEQSPCHDCADSYGAAARLRAIPDERGDDDGFRQMDAIEIEYPRPDEPSDDYRYGGQFPDIEPPAETVEPASDIAVEAPEPPAAANDPPPPDTPPLYDERL